MSRDALLIQQEELRKDLKSFPVNSPMWIKINTQLSEYALKTGGERGKLLKRHEEMNPREPKIKPLTRKQKEHEERIYEESLKKGVMKKERKRLRKIREGKALPKLSDIFYNKV